MEGVEGEPIQADGLEPDDGQEGAYPYAPARPMTYAMQLSAMFEAVNLEDYSSSEESEDMPNQEGGNPPESHDNKEHQLWPSFVYMVIYNLQTHK
jgi:hypothetical protein